MLLHIIHNTEGLEPFPSIDLNGVRLAFEPAGPLDIKGDLHEKSHGFYRF